MRSNWIIFVFLLVSLACSQEDPTNPTNPSDPNTDSDAQQIKILNRVDTYAFLIVCPICFICIFAITIVYLTSPQTRKMPNDIMIALSICDMALLCEWFTVSLYSVLHRDSVNNSHDEGFRKFCSFEATINILASAGEFVYNCIFCAFLLIQIRIGIKGSITWFRALIYHSVALGIIGLTLVITEVTGVSIYGLCQFDVFYWYDYVQLALIFLYLCLASYTIYTFKKQIPDDPAFKKYRQRFLNYYSTYIKSTVVIWTLMSISNLAITIDKKVNPHGDSLDILRTINNLIKLSVPVVLAVIRYINPVIRTTVDRFFRKKVCCCCCCYKKSGGGEGYEEMEEQSDFSELELNWFDGLSSSIRLSQMYTILVGLHKNFGKRINTEALSGETQNYSKSDLAQQITTQHIVAKDMTQSNSNKATIIPMTMTVHCPTIFELFILQDGLIIEQIRDSLKPQLSLKLIDQSSNDGGKSGQFFLFSHDNRVLIKTITEQQVNVYLKRIRQFSDYYISNPKSLITKFYGIFTFQCVEFVAPKIYLFVTRNLTQVGRSKLRGIYDLKGSTFNRKVQKNNRLTMSLKVLKDVDFGNFERRVWGKKQQLDEMREILKKDSQFFNDVGLMDYSLIISKIDIEEDEKVPEFNGQIRSTKEPQILYRIGIVDYLQLWNAKKKLEKTTKKIFNMSPTLDTSAQDPQTYSTRFITLVEKIFPL